MDISTIKDRARRLANVDSTQWSDTEIMEDMNVVYNDLFETIINRVWEDFFTATYKTDTVIWQSGYDLQTATASVEWHKKIKRVEIKYSSDDTYYTKLIEYNENMLDMPLEYYESNTSTIDAFYIIKWNKIHIYPTPTEEILNWVQIEFAPTPIDLILWGAEATVLIPRQFHSLISIGMLQYIYQHLWKINEKNDIIVQYERMKDEMVRELSDRATAPAYWVLPSLSVYE